MDKKSVKTIISFIKKDKIETLITSILQANEETRDFNFEVAAHLTGDIRLYSPKLREWLNAGK